jgi:hypothetical protein
LLYWENPRTKYKVENIFANHICDKALESKYIKDFQNSSNQIQIKNLSVKKRNSIRKWTKTDTKSHFTEEDMQLQINMWKDVPDIREMWATTTISLHI